MVTEEEFERHEYYEIGFTLMLGLIMTIIIPLFFGLALKGFENSFVSGKPLQFGEVLTNYLVYYIFIVGTVIGVTIIALFKINTIKPSQHPATQPNPDITRIFSVNLVHDPEDGALYTLMRKLGYAQRKNWFRWTTSLLRMFAYGFIIFGLVGIISLTNPTFQFIGVPNAVLQQVTPATQVYFTAEPAAFAETGTILIILSIVMGMVAYFTSKYFSDDPDVAITIYFAIGIVLVSPAIGFLWKSFHNIVYQASAQSQYATFFFGTAGCMLTLLFGSWVFFYVWHFTNNLFAGLHKIAPGNADVIFFSYLIWGAFTMLVVGIEIYNWNRKRKKAQQLNIIEPRF